MLVYIRSSTAVFVTPPACPSLVQDLGRLRQLAAVRGLVSSDLRARLWPVLAGGTDAPSLPQSSPAGHALTPRRSSELGRAIPALSPAAVEPALPRAGTALGSEYAEWASGTHKDTGTVSCQAGTQQRAGTGGILWGPSPRDFGSEQIVACLMTTHVR